MQEPLTVTEPISEVEILNKAADHRILLEQEILDRPAVRQFLALLIRAEQMKADLQNAASSPGEFFTKAELDPTSPDYLNRVWSELTVPDTRTISKGYQAAELFAECMSHALKYCLYSRVEKHELGYIRNMCRQALKYLQ